jgi:hypothetical protein
MPTERPPLVGEVSTNFGDRGRHVASARIPYGRNLDFLDRSRYFFIQAAPQLYSQGSVDSKTHYFSENLVAPGIEPELWIFSQEL